MREALKRLRLEWVAAVGLALNILVFAFGSSSVPELRDLGQSLRWVALVLLLVIGAASAIARVGVPRYSAATVVLVSFLGALAVASSLWSVQPRLSFYRGASLCLLLAVAGLLAYGAAGRPRERTLLIGGLVGGAALIAVAGLLILAVNSSYAVVWWVPGGPPTRFRGLGENPNTVSLLFALAIPAAAWLGLVVRDRRARALAGVAFVLLFGELLATQSRGALVGMTAGLVLVAVLQPAVRRRRLAHVAAAAGLIAIAFTIVSIRFTNPHAEAIATQPDQTPSAVAMQPDQTPSAVATQPDQTPSAVATTSDSLPHCTTCSLLGFPGRPDDIGNPFFTGKFGLNNSAFSSSGRLDAWKGAFHTANSRPVAGFGFGTEDRVFVDRYYFFVGGRPENAYLGFYLQLGLLGLLGFVAVGVALLPALVRLVRRGDHQERSLGVAFAAIVLAGFVTAATQSYPYSAGNVATLTFWVAVLGLATARTGSHD